MFWWKSTFFFFICGYFWQFLPSNALTMLYNIRYWWFFFPQDNWRTKYLAHPNIQRSKPCQLIFASLVALDGFHQLLSTQLTDDLSPEWRGGSMFHLLSHIYTKNSFLLHWNNCKQRSESSMCCCFWSTVSNCCTHFKQSFLIDKCSYKMGNTQSSDFLNFSAISHNFNLRSAKMSLWSFLVFSGTTAEFGQPEHLALCLYDSI